MSGSRGLLDYYSRRPLRPAQVFESARVFESAEVFEFGCGLPAAAGYWAHVRRTVTVLPASTVTRIRSRLPSSRLTSSTQCRPATIR